MKSVRSKVKCLSKMNSELYQLRDSLPFLFFFLFLLLFFRSLLVSVFTVFSLCFCLSIIGDVEHLRIRIPAYTLVFGGVVFFSEAERLDNRARRSASLGWLCWRVWRSRRFRSAFWSGSWSLGRRFWSRSLESGRQVRLEEVAVADVAFAISLELDHVLSTVLSKPDDCAAVSPALCLWVLDDDGLTWIKNWQLSAMRVRILVLANLAKSTFNLGAKKRLVVVDRCGQSISDFATEEKLGRRVSGRLARSVVVEQGRLGPFVRVNISKLVVVRAVDEAFHLLDAIFCDSIGLAVVRRRDDAIDVVLGAHERELGLFSELGATVAVDRFRDAIAAEDREDLVDNVFAGGIFSHVVRDGPSGELVDDDEPLLVGVGSEVEVDRLKRVVDGVMRFERLLRVGG